MSQAEMLVIETQATYERQVSEGCYLCDQPMSLTEAANYLSEQNDS